MEKRRSFVMSSHRDEKNQTHTKQTRRDRRRKRDQPARETGLVGTTPSLFAGYSLSVLVD